MFAYIIKDCKILINKCFIMKCVLIPLKHQNQLFAFFKMTLHDLIDYYVD